MATRMSRVRYNDPLVIAGNATLGEELALPAIRSIAIYRSGWWRRFDIRHQSGCARRRLPGSSVRRRTGMANDAARSLRSGRLLANETEPTTIADGVRTLSLGGHNWEILRDGLEASLKSAKSRSKNQSRLLFTLANLKVEPTGALGVAALLAAPKLSLDKLCAA